MHIDEIADAIRAARERLGLTQLDLALRLDVDPATVARWERGATTPAMPALLMRAIADMEETADDDA